MTRAEAEHLANQGAAASHERSSAQTQVGTSTDPASHDQGANTLVGLSPEIELRDAPVAAGDKIGKYEIRRQLGAGGMGAVYLAFDPLIEREVALKVLSPDLGNSSAALQRFLGEARAIGRLNHPNVVLIYEIDLWCGKHYLVMELLRGGSVADQLDQDGRLPWRAATRMTAEAARGLAAAHAVGLVHRDIKPDNLMLTADGAVKVVDFGLSKLQDVSSDQHSAVTRAGQILGTPQYMSPEQFETADVDARTDIYSLGATYFHLLTGRFPYHDCRSIVQMMSAHLTKAVPVPTHYETDLPVECNLIVARAMAKNPADRYQTALEMAADLERLLEPSAKSSTPSVMTDRPLAKALVVEPSKLQAAILKDSLAKAGAASVQVVSSAREAQQAVGLTAPDLLITALELPDGRGSEMLQTLCQQSSLTRTTVVLNSSDVALDDLVAVGHAAAVVLAPKKVRPEEMLRVVHATGPSVIRQGPLAAPIDPAAFRLAIELQSGRIPPGLADLLRELKLFDIDIAAKFDPGAGSTHPNLILLIHRKSSLIDFAAVERISQAGSLVAVIHVADESLTLRAVRWQRITAVCDRPLDGQRMVCLLQACRL